MVGSFCAEDSAGGTEGRLFCGSGFAVSGVDSDSLGAGWGSTSDSPITWDSGENTVLIKVTNGSASETYTITVTKS